jgi:hypothetical protein
MSELLGYLPPRLRLLAAGGLILAALVGGVYAVAAYAATEQAGPIATDLAAHKKTQAQREQEYLYPLLEAIWSDLRSLCAANPTARCDGYNPVRPASE